MTIDTKTLLEPHCQCTACCGGVIHTSDCAVHNMPAMPSGPCDCEVGMNNDSYKVDVLRLIRMSSSMIGNLPELPGYNGSVLTIDDDEAKRIKNDLDVAHDAVKALLAELKSKENSIESGANLIRDRNQLIDMIRAELKRKDEALDRIVAIEDKMYGPDWEEIEEARHIARQAIAGYPMRPDWKAAPSWAKWLAMDSDGEWSWFEDKPKCGYHAWQTEGRYDHAGYPKPRGKTLWRIGHDRKTHSSVSVGREQIMETIQYRISYALPNGSEFYCVFDELHYPGTLECPDETYQTHPYYYLNGSRVHLCALSPAMLDIAECMFMNPHSDRRFNIQTLEPGSDNYEDIHFKDA